MSAPVPAPALMMCGTPIAATFLLIGLWIAAGLVCLLGYVITVPADVAAQVEAQIRRAA